MTEQQILNNNLPNSRLEFAVSEYKTKQKEVTKNFLLGCIELGEILVRHHDTFAPTKNWLEFLEKAGINKTMATQQIRLYKYNQEISRTELLAKLINNWGKLNLFLALEDEKKEEVIENAEILEEATTKEFREFVGNSNEETAYAETTDIKDLDIRDLDIDNVDTKQTAKAIKSSIGASNGTEQAIEGVLFIAKGIAKIKASHIDENDYDKLQNLLIEQMNGLKELIF